LVSKYSLRAHFFALLLTVSLAGAGLSRFLLYLGWKDIVARTAFSFCAGYVLFFACARRWLHVLSRDSRMLHDVAEKEDEPARLVHPAKRRSSGWGDLGFVIPDLDGEFMVILVAVIGLIAILAGAFWIIAEGPVILLDVAFDLALAGGLVQGLKRRQGEGWAGVLFRRSMIPFLLLLTLNLFAVQIAHVACPGNDRLSEMAHDCRKP
jgi:hypothetical protein